MSEKMWKGMNLNESKLENDNIITQPTLFTTSLSLSRKLSPLILDKATAVEKLIIMTTMENFWVP